MTTYTPTQVVKACYDILTSPSVAKYDWRRVAARIEKRLGVKLETYEIKALVVLAQDFDPLSALGQSKSLADDGSFHGPTDTSVHVEERGDEIIVSSEGIRTVGDLMAAAQLDPETWYPVSVKPNYWESLRKGGGVNPHWQIKAQFSRVPSWAREEIEAQELPQVGASEEGGRALFVPDTQHGYRRQEGGELLPMHDVKACALAVEVARRWQPDHIFFLGDHLDLAPWSIKYPQPANVFQTTTPSLKAVHDWLAEFRKACPSAALYYCEGNHENRIYRAIVNKLKEAEGLRTALGELPVLSIPNLLRLDALDVHYIAPYGREFVLWDCVGVSHGTKHGNKVGALLSKRLPEATYSWVQGHDHKLAAGTRAIHDRGKVRFVHGLCPGTLSRVDGFVPGVSLHPNWSQGLGFGVYVEGKAHIWARPIIDGAICLDGEVLKV